VTVPEKTILLLFPATDLVEVGQDRRTAARFGCYGRMEVSA
jgi:hypothetical protein